MAGINRTGAAVGVALLALVAPAAARQPPDTSPADPKIAPSTGPAAQPGTTTTTKAGTAAIPRLQAAPTPGADHTQVKVWAPVAAPYSGTAYRDLGGQPETSADALDAQSPRPH